MISITWKIFRFALSVSFRAWIPDGYLDGRLRSRSLTWTPKGTTRGAPTPQSTSRTSEPDDEPAKLGGGDHATEEAQEEIMGFAPDADITFERLAINWEQVATMEIGDEGRLLSDLSRETTKSDPRLKGYESTARASRHSSSTSSLRRRCAKWSKVQCSATSATTSLKHAIAGHGVSPLRSGASWGSDQPRPFVSALAIFLVPSNQTRAFPLRCRSSKRHRCQHRSSGF
jgi:hypothetical protein